ncbi:MAG: FAD-binding oxidoreductase [Candidatus Omnitrophota bacterium]
MERELKVKEIIQRTYNVKSVRLALEGEPQYQAGQFGCFALKAEKECKRYLSLSSSPTERGYIEFTKKLTESGFSRLLNGLKPGDSLKAAYPQGKFTLEASGNKIAFLSGGIGITPIRSMCKFSVDKNLGKDIVLLYANRSINDIVFKEDFDQMQKQVSGLRVSHVLCEPAPGFQCTAGTINAQVIKNEIQDYLQRKFYLCGPPGMVEVMKKILESELKVPQENIITENFQGY